MRRTTYLVGALAGIAIAAATTQHTFSQAPAPAPAVVAAPTAANVTMPTLTPHEQQMLAQRFSPERLAAIRERAQRDAQRAVRDEAEQSFRAPTAAEAATLASPPVESDAAAVPLARGGAALRAEVSSFEFATATVGDGGAVVSHDGKGARRDQ